MSLDSEKRKARASDMQEFLHGDDSSYVGTGDWGERENKGNPNF
jgi:hypothetical protein